MSNITLYSLSDYNAGTLIPHTFDLDTIDTKEKWYSAISEWLESVDKSHGTDIYTPKREEYIVCDYEDVPSQYIGELDMDSAFWDFKAIVDASHLDADIFEAAANCDIDPADVEEAYQGQYDNDEDFAYQLADECGQIDHMATWPQNCIDWERAARDLMYDYCNDSGHYFRNI